jgi:hypothetical protein
MLFADYARLCHFQLKKHSEVCREMKLPTRLLAISRAAENHTLPIHGLQIGAADVPKLSRRLMSNVVRDVTGVPHNHIVVIDRFAVDEAVEVGFSNAANSAGSAVDSVVQLRAMIA